MRFLGDMGVSQRIIGRLRAIGHDATHLRDEGLHRMPNGEIFRKAAAEKRVVLAFDLDFGQIATQCTTHRASVILFRLVDTTNDHVLARLEAALKLAGDALDRGAIVVVEEARIRVRLLTDRG